MPLFPKIQSPCPYKGQLSDIMDGDQCRLCKRQVVDLNDMGDRERVAFFAGCADQVCVSYSLRPALAAASLVAMLGAPSAAAAQDAAAPVPQAMDFPAEEWIVVGGIADPANVQFVEAPEDASVPELPVTYEEKEDRAEPREVADRPDEQPAPETSSPGS
jgi:hypothetical protein